MKNAIKLTKLLKSFDRLKIIRLIGSEKNYIYDKNTLSEVDIKTQ